MQRNISVTLAPTAGADNDIALSQTPGGAGNLTLNGSLVTSGVATLPQPKRVQLKTAADETAKTFTVTGTDRYGRTQSEVIQGVNNTTAYSVYDYLTVSQVAVSAATAGAIVFGSGAGGKISSQWIPVDRLGTMDLGFGVIVSGTLNYTVEHAMEEPFQPGVGVLPAGGLGALNFTPYPHPTVAAQTSNKDGSYSTSIACIRITLNSFSSGAKATLNLVPGFAGDGD